MPREALLSYCESGLCETAEQLERLIDATRHELFEARVTPEGSELFGC